MPSRLRFPSEQFEIGAGHKGDRQLAQWQRQSPANQARRLTPCCDRTLIEKAGLIGPAMPFRLRFPSEQFEIGAGHKPLDSLSYLLGLATMLTSRLND
jgi:hypothetical protein